MKKPDVLVRSERVAFLVLLFLLCTLGSAEVIPSGEPQTGISFSCPHLEQAVRDAKGFSGSTSGPIFPADVQGIVQLLADGRGITSLEGIHYLVNLETLSLEDNELSSIEELVGLEHLSEVRLDNNQVEEIFPLLALYRNSLSRVSLSGNPIFPGPYSISMDLIRLLREWGVEVVFDPPSARDPSLFIGTGLVTFCNLEGGFFVIKDSDGTEYTPLRGDAMDSLPHYLGRRIRYEARILEGDISYYMRGVYIELVYIY
ncbi:MAG TPA: hypothetical protein P5560_10180 [Thermotogota bacterium]|nr:hypothetical protein [Thermotogota bacterium]HRW93303.1 hypothetical protein [Thermotogota bacterium]